MRRSLTPLVLLAGLMAPAGPVAAGGDDFTAVWRTTGFDRLAVQHRGLTKSALTFARDSLREITHGRLIRDDDKVSLLLHLVAGPTAFADRRLIPVEGDALTPLLTEAGIAVEDRTLQVRDCVEFDPATGQIAGGGRAFLVVANVLAAAEENSPLHTAAARLSSRIAHLVQLRSEFRFIPDPVDRHGLWSNLQEAEHFGFAGTEAIREEFRALLSAVAEGDPARAEPAAANLVGELTAWPNYPAAGRLAVDHLYTCVRPYLWASIAYITSAALFLISLVTHRRGWWVAAVTVMAAGWLVHVLGAVARGYLISRVPLSNLYEATTTGLAFVIFFALLFELIFRMSVVGLTSSLLSFIYYRWLLSSETFGNDAIEPLRAVLNSYWLDYHVTCMILSYGAFTVAFGMGVLYLLRVHFPRLMHWAPPPAELDLYNHRAIQVGWPLLGIGVVLGAVWADTAWGRMWSWDPKETWALITWLIYTAYLHVRLVKGWRGSIMAWASIAGYGCVLFTYLGVNFVLSGLHSYAGNDPVILMGPIDLLRRHWLLIVPGCAAGLSVVGWAILKLRGEPDLPATAED